MVGKAEKQAGYQNLGKKNPLYSAGWNPICHEIGGDSFIMLHRKICCQLFLRIVGIFKTNIGGDLAANDRAFCQKMTRQCTNMVRFLTRFATTRGVLAQRIMVRRTKLRCKNNDLEFFGNNKPIICWY